MLLTGCWSVLVIAGVALCAPASPALFRRAVVPHDSLNPIPTRVQSGANGAAIKRFNPRLHIASGCQPYTAVDDAGNTSGGLKPSGSSTGGCRDTSKGQAYARIGQLNGKTGILYAFYFPKDQLISGISPGSHRNDWEAMVVWINDPAAANPTVLGGAASGHGDFKKVKGALKGGDSAQIEYFAQFPTNHELQFTDTVGVTYPVSDWDAMPAAEKAALQNADFGDAMVPFKDGNFESNLRKAEI